MDVIGNNQPWASREGTSKRMVEAASVCGRHRGPYFPELFDELLMPTEASRREEKGEPSSGNSERETLRGHMAAGLETVWDS